MKLKKYRTIMGLTQQQLAKKIGVVVSHINMIEGGSRRPSPSLAKKIVKITDGAVTLEELLFGKHGG